MTSNSTSDWMKLPNILAYLRTLVVVLIVVFYSIPWGWGHYVAAGLFALAAVTDWLDGYLARRWKMHSRLGEFLDPVADKLLVVISLVLMVHAYNNIWVTFMVMIIIGREISVMAMRHWMAAVDGNPIPVSLQVNLLGKIKTVLQMSSIAWFLAFPPGKENLFPHWIAIIILTVATLMTLWSGFIYARLLIRNYAKE